MAEFVVTDSRSLIPLADEFSFEQSASFFVNPLTAVCMVERCKELGTKACIVTAAASQIGRMLVPILIQNGIIPICTVRRPEQAEILKKIIGKFAKNVVDTSQPDFKKQLGMICMRLKPSTCLECISGDMTGTILEFMGFESRVLLYGLLSDKPAGNINTIGFIGKA